MRALVELELPAAECVACLEEEELWLDAREERAADDEANADAGADETAAALACPFDLPAEGNEGGAFGCRRNDDNPLCWFVLVELPRPFGFGPLLFFLVLIF